MSQVWEPLIWGREDVDGVEPHSDLAQMIRMPFFYLLTVIVTVKEGKALP